MLKPIITTFANLEAARYAYRFIAYRAQVFALGLGDESLKPSAQPGPWVSLLRAAEHLGEPAESLRKKVERAARGATTANIAGIEFRKFARNWKAKLPSEWF